MRKLVLSILSTLSYTFITPIAYAQTPISTIPTGVVNPCDSTGIFGAICKLGSPGGGSVGSVIGGFVSLFFAIATIIAVIYLIYGGIKWITSRGEKDQVEASRNHIIAAIIGLIMVFLAFFLINFVLGFFIQGFNITNVALPSLTTLPSPTPAK